LVKECEKEVKMRKVFTIIWITLFLCIAVSCVTQRSASDKGRENLDRLSRQEINDLAIVQILLVKEKNIITGGSGFFVNKDGYIVTAHHVVDFMNYDEGIQTFVNYDYSLYPAKTVAFDNKKDLAALKIATTTPVPFVLFANSDTLIPQSKLTFHAIPPAQKTFSSGAFLSREDHLVSENHRIIVIRNLEEMLSNPDTRDFIQDELLRNILFDPVTISLISDPMSRKHLPYPRETIDLLIFFLADRESRIFFSDPDKRMSPGCSGGAAFNEEGFCVGMLQEILAVFKPNPKSRYIHPNKPPTNNRLFPLLEKMIGAGQNSNNISAFLNSNGIVHYSSDREKIALIESGN
jgi:hypothetical protein